MSSLKLAYIMSSLKLAYNNVQYCILDINQYETHVTDQSHLSCAHDVQCKQLQRHTKEIRC